MRFFLRRPTVQGDVLQFQDQMFFFRPEQHSKINTLKNEERMKKECY